MNNRLHFRSSTTLAATALLCIAGGTGASAAQQAAPAATSDNDPQSLAVTTTTGEPHLLPGVISVDAEGRPDGIASKTATGRNAAVVAALIQCYQVSARKDLKTTFGLQAAHVLLNVSWCSNGSTLTSHGVFRDGKADTSFFFWRGWTGAIATGGNGSSSYRYSTQGLVENCVTFCINQWAPTIGWRVNANGSASRVDTLSP